MPKLKNLFDHIETYTQILHDRNASKMVSVFENGLTIYEEWREHLMKIESLRNEMNTLSREYGKTREESLLQRSKEVKVQLPELDKRVRELAARIGEIEKMLPNWISDDVPRGPDESFEKPVNYGLEPKVWPEFREQFESDNPGIGYDLMEGEPFHHYNLVGRYVDQERAGNVVQSRFYYEFDEVAILDMALSMYAIEFFRNHGCADRMMIPPFMMRRTFEERITFMDAFEDTIFEVPVKDQVDDIPENEDRTLLLIPSSEHPILAFYTDQIFKAEDLPIRVGAWSPCFRREAGSHGKDTLGIFRVKQFQKVELHSIVREGEDFEELDRLVGVAELFLESLGIPYRTVIVPSGDMDKRALKQIDIQSWMPAQGKYRETHSLATLGTWVSEKLLMRYIVEKKKKELTRNIYATGVAIQRTICSLVENHYDPLKNSVRIPEVLKKYMMGIEEIEMT